MLTLLRGAVNAAGLHFVVALTFVITAGVAETVVLSVADSMTARHLGMVALTKVSIASITFVVVRGITGVMTAG